MCGISGRISRTPLSPEQRAGVSRMNRALIHRGPDNEGRFGTSHVALAMRRLSIIDLEGAAQPLSNADGSVTLVFNGEIYNYRELRSQLSADGYAFRTFGDGEVIVALFEKHGLDFVQHLRGMFAIALYDAVQRRLVLARDRMGEKPLYLYKKAGDIVFASEMKALMRSGEIDFALDAEAVHLYFHYQYVPEPRTAVAGVSKLPAATLLVVELEPWRVEERSYWSMAAAPSIKGDEVERLRESLDEAARLTVRADVPVGVALSGGLDSAVVAALAKRHRPDGITALTVGYAGRPDHDERRGGPRRR